LQPENAEEQTLTSLGLTPSQARVYLALIHKGSSKVIPISQTTGIHRAHLYEILHALEANGLVERNLGKGVFTATPLKEIAPILVKQKQQEILTLQNQVNTIADYASLKTTTQIVDPEFVMTSNKNLTLNRAQKCMGAAKSHLESMHTWKRFLQLWEHYETVFVDNMDRGVVIKEIIEFPKDIDQAQETLKEKKFKHKNCELRFVSKTGGNFTIIDGEMLLLSTTQEKENLGETPFLFSNYEGLLGLMEQYFELGWASSSDLNPNKKAGNI
jgi:sugar-specific transcriptional regulator TrmB